MSAPGSAPTLPIGRRIPDAYPELGPQERRAADVMLSRLADLAVYSAADLAREAGVSKATVSRLFRRLGFADAAEVRSHVRALRSSGVPVPGGAGSVGRLESETGNLRAGLEAASGPEGRLAARLIADARRVIVIGLRNGYPVALHLREQLAQARDDVRIAPASGQTLSEELADAAPGDVVVAVLFRRRPADADRLVTASVASGADVVLVGDPSVRSLAAGSAAVMAVPTEVPGPLDSYAGAMAAVGLLASTVVDLLGEVAVRRLDRLSRLEDALGELERA